MTTIVGIPASLPAQCPSSNQMQRAGLCSHIAITLAKRGTLSTGTPSIFAGLQPQRRFFRALYRQNVIAMPTVLSRRSAYETVGPDFRETILFDDWEMWLRIAARFDVGFVDVFDANYRIHTAQKSHDVLSRMGEHRLALLDEVDRLLPLDFPAVDKRRARSGAYFRASYDAFTRGERRRAGLTRDRVPYSPTALLDPKMATLAFAALSFRVRQRALWKRSRLPRESIEPLQSSSRSVELPRRRFGGGFVRSRDPRHTR